jgi:hypothetical protein
MSGMSRYDEPWKPYDRLVYYDTEIVPNNIVLECSGLEFVDSETLHRRWGEIVLDVYMQAPAKTAEGKVMGRQNSWRQMFLTDPPITPDPCSWHWCQRSVQD